MAGPHQIFYDPTGSRKRIVNAACLSLALASAAIAAVLALGMLIALKIPSISEVRTEPHTSVDHGMTAWNSLTPGFSLLSSRPISASAATVRRFAFFNMMESESHASLRQHAADLDGLMPDFLMIGGRDGGLVQQDPAIETRLRRWMKANSPSLEIYPVLSIGPDPSKAAAYLEYSELRSPLVAAIARYIQQNGDAGVTLTLSNLQPNAHSHVVSFMSELADAIHPSGKKVIIEISVTSERSRVQELARFADLVILNTYSDVSRGDDAGPIASQGWFETQLETILAVVPVSKIVVGIGTFACDFSGLQQHEITSIQNAYDLMVNARTPLLFDQQTLNPHFSVTGANGVTHDIWMLDGVTVFNHLKAALVKAPAGVALWRLGLEDPSAWASFAKGRLPDGKALSELARPQPGYVRLDDNAHLEFAELQSEAKEGNRSIAFDAPAGLIVQQSLEMAPAASQYAEWLVEDYKRIALTFDDGPDDKMTSQILDHLAEKSAKGTFFVVGRNAMQNPKLIRRIYAEGHDIGNHTYSHKFLPDLTATEFDFELTATQRILEGQLGIHTTLFRPPYEGGALPDAPEAPRIIADASRLGYLTVLGGVLPLDWLNPSATKIRDRVVAQVLSGRGQVIVLHDWGQRQATVDAVPMIIDKLRAEGYKFVTIHELLGKSRTDVMPVSATADAMSLGAAIVRRESIKAFSWLTSALPWSAAIGGILCIGRLILVMTGVQRHRRLEKNRAHIDFWPNGVSIIVPAYNEATVIGKTIRSVLQARRTDFDILVIDDGSTDGTADSVRAEFSDDPRVKVFSKPNGGKAAAANFALNRTTAEVVVCIDADTVIASDAIPLLVRHFADAAVGAVAGTAVVGNTVNLLTRFQSVEYAVGQYLDRRAFAYVNANGIVPGAIGAWRREALLRNGGYASDTLAEDADATFSVARAGWKVIYEPAAEARTEAPETLRAFMKQRYRWMFGMLQVISKHRAAVFTTTPNSIGWLTIPNIVLFQFGFSILIPILDGVAIWQLLSITQFATPGTDVDVTSGMERYVLWWAIFLVFDLAVMLAALRIAAVRRSWVIAPVMLVQRVLYWPLIYWTAWSTLFGAAKGQFVGWGKLKRTGGVVLETHSAVGGLA
jgi:peptidoglycan-N-acetylglucosamine deacetylase